MTASINGKGMDTIRRQAITWIIADQVRRGITLIPNHILLKQMKSYHIIIINIASYFGNLLDYNFHHKALFSRFVLPLSQNFEIISVLRIEVSSRSKNRFRVLEVKWSAYSTVWCSAFVIILN